MISSLIAALIVSLVITVVAAVLGRKGPWGATWAFFLILFLALWIVALFIRSVGPVYYGIAWVPLIVAGILLALLLVAAMPDANHWRDESLRNTESGRPAVPKERDLPATGVGGFFWLLIMLMIIAVILGMMNPQTAL